MSDQQQLPWRNRIVRSGDAALGEIVANPANWRTHPKHQADALSGVLADVGYVQQVVINERSGCLVDGHLRVALATQHGEASVPAVWVDLDDDEERLILATLDPLGALAETDDAQLRALLASVTTSDDALADLLASVQPSAGFVAGGDTDGLSPADRLGIFEANQIRQIALHYAADEYAEAVELLETLRDEYGEDNNAEAVLRLLREHRDARA